MTELRGVVSADCPGDGGIFGLAGPRGELPELIGIDPVVVEGDFIRRANQLPLPALQHANEFGGFQQRIMGARVEPREIATQAARRRGGAGACRAD